MSKRTWAVILVCMFVSIAVVTLVQAAEPLPPEFKAAGNWYEKLELGYKWGGDVRVRGVTFDNIPINTPAGAPAVTRQGQNNFMRFRTRLWAEGTVAENVALRIRLVNEFRYYSKPDTTDNWDALDEIIIDSLYVDFNKLLNDSLDLRLGRQDLVYGTGKVILEGTPKDGSRTIYMDAVKATIRGIPDTSLDVLGIYNQPENEMAINSQERDLTGLARGFNDMTESGGALYAKNKSFEMTPLEAYYIYKRESDWLRNPGTTNQVTVPENTINTFGVRAMPKFNDQFDANVELAYQFGETGSEDMSGLMIDALGNWHMPYGGDKKPCLGLGWYYLSGDDPNTAKDEGWNPLWARWPQYSELYIYAFDADGAGRWSNVSMPHLDFTFAPIDKLLRMKFMAAYLMAPEDDRPGGGAGSERGFLGVWRNDFLLKEKMLSEKDKLFGHLLFEVLEPGNYSRSTDTAYFVRLELSYAF